MCRQGVMACLRSITSRCSHSLGVWIGCWCGGCAKRSCLPWQPVALFVWATDRQCLCRLLCCSCCMLPISVCAASKGEQGMHVGSMVSSHKLPPPVRCTYA